MNLLLDTHALFWAIYKPERLSVAALQALAEPGSTVWATLASAQEIALKLAIGKWQAALDLLLHFDAHVQAAGFGLIVPSAVDYANLLRLPEVPDHRDRFDHLLVAQAQARGMTLEQYRIKRDRLIRGSACFIKYVERVRCFCQHRTRSSVVRSVRTSLRRACRCGRAGRKTERPAR